MIMFERWWLIFERQVHPEIYANDEEEDRKAVARCAYRQALDFVMTMFHTNMTNKIPPFDVYEEIKAELKS